MFFKDYMKNYFDIFKKSCIFASFFEHFHKSSAEDKSYSVWTMPRRENVNEVNGIYELSTVQRAMAQFGVLQHLPGTCMASRL